MVLGVAKQAVSNEEAKRDRDYYNKSPKGLVVRRRVPPTGGNPLSKSGSATKILSKTKAGRVRARQFGSLNPRNG